MDRENPSAALRIAVTIYEGCKPPEGVPSMGQASRRISGRRELMFPPLPYMAGYQVKSGLD